MNTNAKLEAIAKKCGEILTQSIREESERILQAWDDATDEAHANDKEACNLGLSFGIKLDIGAGKMTTRLSFGVKRTLEHACDIPDPDQLELLEGQQ